MGGIFEVFIDDKTVYSNQTTYRFPTNEEIFEQVDAAKKS
jgi:selT/selW/selH-like putative selenoprotein